MKRDFVSKKLSDLVIGDLRWWYAWDERDFTLVMFVSAERFKTDEEYVLVTYLHSNGALFTVTYDESHFASESCTVLKNK